MDQCKVIGLIDIELRRVRESPFCKLQVVFRVVSRV